MKQREIAHQKICIFTVFFTSYVENPEHTDELNVSFEPD